MLFSWCFAVFGLFVLFVVSVEGGFGCWMSFKRGFSFRFFMRYPFSVTVDVFAHYPRQLTIN